ncbi:MAG: hypothetical protein AB7Q64_23360 [Verrucomicrobiales bacterium]
MAKRRSHLKPGKKRQAAKSKAGKPSSSWKDHFLIAAWITVPLAATIAFVFFLFTSKWNSSITLRLDQWRQAYQLDDATVDRLRVIEVNFHGNGNPFTGPIPHTKEEVAVHLQEMASLMGEPQGDEFLNDMRRGRWRHR